MTPDESREIVYPNFTVSIDYFKDNDSLVIIVKDVDGVIIEGLHISDAEEEGSEGEINPNLN